MIFLFLLLACGAVGVWLLTVNVIWMAWFLFFVACVCMLHFIEWLVKG